MKYICRWHGMRYKITLLSSDHGCTCGWVSEFLVFSFFIHLLSNCVQRCWDKDCNYKMKVTQVHPGKWYALNWKNRQTGNFHTDSQIQNRYKRWRTKLSEGTANIVTTLQLSGGGATEADAWRTGTSAGDGGEKHGQRPEVGSYGVWLVGCRAEAEGGAKEIRPTASAGPRLMWVFRAFTERKG